MCSWNVLMTGVFVQGWEFEGCSVSPGWCHDLSTGHQDSFLVSGPWRLEITCCDRFYPKTGGSSLVLDREDWPLCVLHNRKWQTVRNRFSFDDSSRFQLFLWSCFYERKVFQRRILWEASTCHHYDAVTGSDVTDIQEAIGFV